MPNAQFASRELRFERHATFACFDSRCCMLCHAPSCSCSHALRLALCTSAFSSCAQRLLLPPIPSILLRETFPPVLYDASVRCCVKPGSLLSASSLFQHSRYGVRVRAAVRRPRDIDESRRCRAADERAHGNEKISGIRTFVPRASS